jgi:hypothetical protein
MRPNDETIHLLGKHYRELPHGEPTLPCEMQALILRIALNETERSHYGALERTAQALHNGRRADVAR